MLARSRIPLALRSLRSSPLIQLGAFSPAQTITIPPPAVVSDAQRQRQQQQQQQQQPAPVPAPTSTSTIALAGTRANRMPYSTASTGKPQADEIIEEIQDLYETAKDEFEIASESTDGATIYAASDRESARDALDQLLAVYSIYTSPFAEAEAEAEAEIAELRGATGAPGAAAAAAAAAALGDSSPLRGRVSSSAGVEEALEEEEDFEDGAVIELGVDPEEITEEVREEVKRRIGGRIRELQSAVEALEGRAKAD